MNIQGIRTELAALAPEGWNTYDYDNGSMTTPAVAIGLPTNISFDGSYKLTTLSIPVNVIVGPLFSPDAEATLLTEVLTIANSFRNVSGSNFRSCRVEGIANFGPATYGSTEAYSATISLQILATS